MRLFTPIAVWLGGLSWLPRFLRQITWVDKQLQRVTGGRLSLVRIAGLPGVMLTVTGRRSGLPRSTPLLATPYGDGQLVAGSNFGGARAPAWVANVRAAGTVQVSIGGRTHTATARELTGEERAAAWAHMLRTWPNYAKYEQRTDRTIPVFWLTPTA